MEELELIVNSLIEQAKNQAGKLNEQLETEGQIGLPQPLAEMGWSNSKGEEFGLLIMLDLSQSTLCRQLGITSLQLYTIYDGKFVIDNYRAGLFSPFASTVSSEGFRTQTEKYIRKMMADDGNGLKKRICRLGTYAIQSLTVPDNVQMVLRQIPSTCTLTICGVVFDGIDDILDYWRNQTDNSHPYIIDRSQRFPCFDSEDYATERRFYRNFLICHSKQEADKKFKGMQQQQASNNYCLVNKNLSADMRPMLYYMDESQSMILAY